MKRLAALMMIIAAPSTADTPMGAAEFEAYTQGKTLYYGTDGKRYGVEEYLPDRRVRWSFLDGKCKDGFWYEDAGLVCFVYEDNAVPQCWSFLRTPGGISAKFETGDNATQLYQIEGDAEMLCLGPEVGV